MNMGASNPGLAPIIVSVYNRPGHFLKCIEALQRNQLAAESELYVISDAASRENDVEAVREVRRVASALEGFAKVHLVAREENWGFFRSIQEALAAVLKIHHKYIFLEDDLEVSRGFLEFLNLGLEKFQGDPRIYSIGGYCPRSAVLDPQAHAVAKVMAGPFFCPWGFATWKDRQEVISAAVNNYPSVLKNRRILSFLARQSPLMLEVLRKDHFENLDAVDVRISCQMLLKNMFSIYPSASLARNTGCDGSGEHMGENETVGTEDIADELRLDSWDIHFDPAFSRKIVRNGTGIRFQGVFSALYFLNLREAGEPAIELARRLCRRIKQRQA